MRLESGLGVAGAAGKHLPPSREKARLKAGGQAGGMNMVAAVTQPVTPTPAYCHLVENALVTAVWIIRTHRAEITPSSWAPGWERELA